MRRLLAAGVRVAVVGVRVVPMGVGQRLVGVEVVVPRTPGSLLSRLVFVLVVFALGLVSWLGRKMIEATGLRPVDRALGAVFGTVRAGVLLLVFALVVTSTTLQQSAWWQESLVAPWLSNGLQQLRPLLPEEFGKYLPP